MRLFKKVKDLQSYLNWMKIEGASIGFAPTMGALHQGHLSLIRQSKGMDDYTISSIFVNPTQFNLAADLKKYPRTVANDIKLLTSVDTDILFFPPVEEVYPPGLETAIKLDFGTLATVMEGKHRPGHFEGMAQVVNRLLNIVQPQRLYMGQKDFQQFTIVKSMIHQLKKDIELIVCPIIREPDGLAMSSRNIRLAEKDRIQAPLIHQTLQETKYLIPTGSPKEIMRNAMKKLSVPASFRPEYFEIVDGTSLEMINDFNEHDYIVACTAVWVGEVRLIDNIILKDPNTFSK